LNDTEHPANVALEFGQLDDAMTWCEENCVAAWHLGRIDSFAGDRSAEYEFVFTDERDKVHFLLAFY
jgi:hypothetical protein